jgi:hypothetical protein
MGLVQLLNDPEGFRYHKNQDPKFTNANNVNPLEIPFGKDRPGGGSSNQPYVQKPIQIEIKNPSFYNDFILRGGILAPIAAANDVVRLSKYFIDLQNPNGILFTAKQNLLSRIGTKTEASKGLGYAGGALNEGVYLPTSTVAQAGVGFTGTHLNKQGIDPTGLFPGLGIKNYGDVAFDNNKLEKNSVPGRVPDSLYRKAELASNKLQKKLDSLAAIVPKQETFNVLEDLNSVSSSPFLSKWEEYRISQLDKKVSRKETRKNDALANFNSSIDDITEAKTSTIIIYDNRLLNLWDSKGLNLVNPLYGNDPVIQSYGGGPSSILGIGKTKIKFATLNDGVTPLRTGVNMSDPYIQYGRRLVEYKTTNIFGKTFMPNSYGSVSLTYAEKMHLSVSETNLFGSINYLEDYNNKSNIDLSNPNDPYSNSLSKFKTWSRRDFNIQSQPTTIDSETKEDFRKSFEINTKTNTFLSASPSYINKNIETRLNLGNPGQKGDISSYTNGKKSITTSTPTSLGPADKVNASWMYKTSTAKGSNYGKTGFDNLNDIIPFYIAILNNQSQNGGPYKKYMHFRSYIDSFSDSYDAEWNPIEYMGRAEKFYKYGGFNRKISMAFTIVAQSREEITAMYDKLNFLASSLAPEYLDSTTSGYMAGNIAYITLGGYLDDQPGVITSLTYDIPEESPWEIGIDDNGLPITGSDVRQMPHMIKVTGINFIPIHKFRPEKQTFKEDGGNLESVRLLDTGKQRYLDQLRGEITNYDKGANEENNARILKEQKIAVQTQYNEGLLNTPTQPTSTIDDVVGNNGALVF